MQNAEMNARTAQRGVVALNPLIAVLLAFALCVAAFLTQSIPMLVLLVIAGSAIGFVGGRARTTLRLVGGLVAISAFLFVLQLLFIRTGTPVFAFVTDEGLATAARVVLRLMAATIPLALVLTIISTNDLANALVKDAHLPYRYAFTVSTALRFIPVFTQEMSAIMEAQTARGVCFDTRNPVKKAALMMPLCMPLLVTSVGRIQQAALSAETRGFYLRTRESGFKRYPFKAADAVVIALCVALVVAGVLL